MSNWVLNTNTAIPFSGSLGSPAYPYVYFGDQAVTSQIGQAVLSEGYGGRAGLSGAPGRAPTQPTVAGSLQAPAANTHLWPSQQIAPAQHGVISGIPDITVRRTPNEDVHVQKVNDLERELQSARAQFEKEQQEGRNLLAQVESLTSELVTERQRSEDLGRQLLAVSAAHQAMQAEHQRLLTQHAAIVREHEHMTSSQAAALRELEARNADVFRLQRQLEEAQAAAALNTEEAAAAGVQQPGGAAPRGSSVRPGGYRASRPPPLHVSGHSSAVDEERWALRLHKAERALEEERRVSEDLRQQLKCAEAESRATLKKLKQLENGVESPSGGAVPVSNSEPLPKLPNVLSPLSLQPPSLGAMSSGALAGTAGGSLKAMATGLPSAAGATLGRAASAGSGIGQAQIGGVKPGVSSSAFLSATAATLSGGGGSGAGTPQQQQPNEEQLVRMKKEVDGLRSDLSRLAAEEEMHRVAARAAEDRARAAELVSLDVRRQCDQAARTIGRLIDENSELVAKVNAQANALADCKKSAASKEAILHNLEERLAQAQAQLAATQAQATERTPQPPDDTAQHQPHGRHQSNGKSPPDMCLAGSGKEGATHGSVPQSQHPLLRLEGQGQAGGTNAAPPSREVLPPGGPLTESDWKLVMLAEEVRRLVEEVSLSTTACLALQLKSQYVNLPHQNQHANGLATQVESCGATATAVPGEPQSPALDLPRVLTRLEGLAGRRLGPGETAAYIVELAGHMEALDQVLQAQKRRMMALRGEQMEQTAGCPRQGSGAGAKDKVVGSDVRSGSCPEDAPRSDGTPSGQVASRQVASSEHSGQLQQGEQHQQQQRFQAGAQAGPAVNDGVQVAESRAGVGQEKAQAHGVAGPMEAQHSVAAPPAQGGPVVSRVTVRDTAPGSFEDSGVSSVAHSGSGGPQQQALPQPMLPASPEPSPQLVHHVVSPFNNLGAQRRDYPVQPIASHLPDSPHLPDKQQLTGLLQQGQQQGLVASGGPAPVNDASAGASISFRDTHRSDLAAAAAAAVAAAAAAPGAPEVDSTVGAEAASSAVPVVLEPYEAPPSPRAAAGAVAVSSPGAQLVTVAVGVDVPRVAAPQEDDLLDEAAASRVKPRRPRVGLWGWISGEPSR